MMFENTFKLEEIELAKREEFYKKQESFFEENEAKFKE